MGREKNAEIKKDDFGEIWDWKSTLDWEISQDDDFFPVSMSFLAKSKTSESPPSSLLDFCDFEDVSRVAQDATQKTTRSRLPSRSAPRNIGKAKTNDWFESF